MTIMRTEVDGTEYMVLHYRFAINNPHAIITKHNNIYYAKIGEIKYILGFTKRDGSLANIANQLENSLHKE